LLCCFLSNVPIGASVAVERWFSKLLFVARGSIGLCC
jgi:hypothetical protein